MIAVALVYFIWGVIDMIAGAGEKNDEKRIAGKRHMIWGIVGLFIMVCVKGIMQLILNFWKGI